MPSEVKQRSLAASCKHIKKSLRLASSADTLLISKTSRKRFEKGWFLLMKKTRTTVFSKARIEEVDGELLIIEAGKKDAPDNVYSLTNELNEWLGVEGISLTIKKDEEIIPDDMIEPEYSDEFYED